MLSKWSSDHFQIVIMSPTRWASYAPKYFFIFLKQYELGRAILESSGQKCFPHDSNGSRTPNHSAPELKENKDGEM